MKIQVKYYFFDANDFVPKCATFFVSDEIKIL